MALCKGENIKDEARNIEDGEWCSLGYTTNDLPFKRVGLDSSEKIIFRDKNGRERKVEHNSTVIRGKKLWELIDQIPE